MSLLSRVVNYDMLHNSSPDHVYVDISIANNNTNPNAQPVSIEFSESRNSNYVEDASQYYLSIIKFKIDTLSLPVFIPLIQVNNEDNDVNLTVYSFTMKYKTFEVQVFLEYMPQDISIAVPTSVETQNLQSEYYFIYNHKSVVKMLNTTLQSAFTALNNLVVAGSDTLPTNKSPFFIYDGSSGALVLNADINAYNTALANPIYLYANPSMYNLLSGFEYTRCGYSALNGKNFMFNIYDDNTNTLEITDTYSVFNMFEEFNSVSLWSPVQSIVFTTPNLPINGTIVSQPKTFNSNVSMVNNSLSTTQNIITDMSVAMIDGKEYLPSVSYLPFNYRLTDLNGRQGISQIKINCFWKDAYSNLYLMKLHSNSSAQMKVLFIKKSFYHN
jgi:hypothetical protein